MGNYYFKSSWAIKYQSYMSQLFIILLSFGVLGRKQIVRWSVVKSAWLLSPSHESQSVRKWKARRSDWRKAGRKGSGKNMSQLSEPARKVQLGLIRITFDALTGRRFRTLRLHHEQHGRGREDRGQPDRQKPSLRQSGSDQTNCESLRPLSLTSEHNKLATTTKSSPVQS